jgi:hypothetical protein
MIPFLISFTIVFILYVTHVLITKEDPLSNLPIFILVIPLYLIVNAFYSEWPETRTKTKYEVFNEGRHITDSTRVIEPVKKENPPNSSSLSCGDNNFVYITKTEYDSNNFGIPNLVNKSLLTTNNYPQGISCDKTNNTFDKALSCSNEHWYLAESKYSTTMPNTIISSTLTLLTTGNNPQGIICK